MEEKYLKDLYKLFPKLPIEVKENIKVKKMEEGELIFSKGDRVKYIYILCEGSTRALNFFKSGNIYDIGKNSAITFIGEQEVISKHTTYSVSVETTTPCTLLLLDIDIFLKWLKIDIDLAHFLLRQLSERVYYSSAEKGNSNYLSARELIISYFIKKYKENCGEILIFNETQQELAEQIGTSLRSLARVIAELKKEKIISISKKKININLQQYELLLNLQK